MHSGELELPKLTWCEEIRHRGDRPRLYLPSKDYRIIGCRLSDRFYDALMSGAMCMLCVVFTSKRYFYFFLSSGGWGKIKLKLTTLSRIFVRVVCRFISVAFAAQLPNGLGTHLVTVLIIFTDVYYEKKKKIHSYSCEIEDFGETHLCKLCAKLRSRVTGKVSSIRTIGRRLPFQLQ